MSGTNDHITHVSDTALWVAVYRAQESRRPDALFRDPLAETLAGERGFRIARGMQHSNYTSWSLVIRTVIIDGFIQDLIRRGEIDTVVNLGTGLDTRPYRLTLPADLRWIEVDFPSMIQHKESLLRSEIPHCKLERIALDLTDRGLRRELFAKIASGSKNVLILTEGVVPYLSDEQTAELAQDLRAQSSFRFWITDYFAPEVMKYVIKRRKDMENAPFKFNPPDWHAFYARQGWKVAEMKYMGEESLRLGRAIPMPWFARLMSVFFKEKVLSRTRHMMGYALLEPRTPLKNP